MTPADIHSGATSRAIPLTAQILLFASETSARRVAQTLAQELNAAVTAVSDQRRCQELLQQKTFTLIIMEEVIATENEATLKSLYDMAAGSFILEVNFGTANLPRVVRQVRAALKRREVEYTSARLAALTALQGQLSASVSGLLLESQLALRNAGPGLAPILEHLVALAEALCAQLRF